VGRSDQPDANQPLQMTGAALRLFGALRLTSGRRG
jgi:hypothetical protein